MSLTVICIKMSDAAGTNEWFPTFKEKIMYASDMGNLEARNNCLVSTCRIEIWHFGRQMKLNGYLVLFLS